MENVNLSQANQVYLQKQQNHASNPIKTKHENIKIENGENKIKNALAGLAIIGVAIATGVAIYKGRGNKVAQEAGESVNQIKTKLLKDVQFNKGIATLEDGSKFTGVIEDTLKNGDKITLEYADGVIKKSQRSGSKTLEKVYSKTSNGDLLVNNKNILEISRQAKKHQDDFKSLMQRQDASLDELQGFDRKNLSKKQIDELDGIVKAKKEAIELEAKKAQELAEKEARKAQEREAKEAAERFATKVELSGDEYINNLPEPAFYVTDWTTDRLEAFLKHYGKTLDDFDAEYMKFLKEVVYDPKSKTKISYYDYIFNGIEPDKTITKDTIFYHGTTAEAKKSILKNGFDLSKNKHHESGRGVYTVTFDPGSMHGGYKYGDGTIVKMKLSGDKKIGRIQDDMMVSKLSNLNKAAEKALEQDILSNNLFCNPEILRDSVVRQLKKQGYSGLSLKTSQAHVPYTVIWDPSDLKIIG